MGLPLTYSPAGAVVENRAGRAATSPRVPCSRRRKIVNPVSGFNRRLPALQLSLRLYCECSKNSTTPSAISSGMIR